MTEVWTILIEGEVWQQDLRREQLAQPLSATGLARVREPAWDTRGTNIALPGSLVSDLCYLGPILNTAFANNVFIMISTNAISYITLKNIGEMVPNLCQEVGFLGRIKEGGGVLILTNG